MKDFLTANHLLRPGETNGQEPYSISRALLSELATKRSASDKSGETNLQITNYLFYWKIYYI